MRENFTFEMEIHLPMNEDEYDFLMDVMNKSFKLGIYNRTDFNVLGPDGDLQYSEVYEPAELYVYAVNHGIIKPFDKMPETIKPKNIDNS